MRPNGNSIAPHSLLSLRVFILSHTQALRRDILYIFIHGCALYVFLYRELYIVRYVSDCLYDNFKLEFFVTCARYLCK